MFEIQGQAAEVLHIFESVLKNDSVVEEDTLSVIGKASGIFHILHITWPQNKAPTLHKHRKLLKHRHTQKKNLNDLIILAKMLSGILKINNNYDDVRIVRVF